MSSENLKKSGKFYTPKVLAEWVTYYLSTQIDKPVVVLEPSCGSGNFIKALDKSEIQVLSLDAIEIDKDGSKLIEKPKVIENLKIFNCDFLEWKSQEKYDLVIGNPPFIIKKLLKPNQIELCKQIHKDSGLKDGDIANIWTSFLLKSCKYLTEDGVLALVLPTEILQVKYAEEIREYLVNNFSRVELVTFRHLAFEGIEQDTVVVFAYKKAKSSGVFMKEVNKVSSLERKIPQFTHIPNHILNHKWTTGILSEDEILLFENIRNTVESVNKYCSSVAGIVTAGMKFFILRKDDLGKFDSKKYFKKIINKGFYVNNCVDFTDKRFSLLERNRVPCYLLDTNSHEQLPDALAGYLEVGIRSGLDKSYKCRQRKRWHDVPGIKTGEGFFFRRAHDHPKCIKNSANVLVTDSAYQFVMLEGYAIDNFVFSFYNSLTLLASEMYGRYYGGGVLELTPNEFRNLPIPYVTCPDFEHFSSQFEGEESKDRLLAQNDQVILSKHLGLNDDQIKRLNNAYKKMKLRRMKGE